MQIRGARQDRGRRAFTLVELLIVIGIIILLISILIPVVSKVRIAGQNASAQTLIQQIARAIDAYEVDFKAYPGPLTNTEVYNENDPLNTKLVPDPDMAIATAGYLNTSIATKKVTMAENLVLGLLGGLRRNSIAPFELQYDPRLIGGGPYSLGAASGSAKRYKNYIEATSLSWRVTELPDDSPDVAGLKTGRFRDASGAADDSIIPEFVDPYPDPMPILYLRAKRGAAAAGALTEINNTIVTYNATDPNNRVGQYDLHQIIAYTTPPVGGRPIGVGRARISAEGWGPTPPVHGLSASAASPIDVTSAIRVYDPLVTGVTFKYPFDAYAYFRNQSLSTPRESDGTAYATKLNRNDVPHQKDGYILISAGGDRVYGTRDDITNFGAVGQ